MAEQLIYGLDRSLALYVLNLVAYAASLALIFSVLALVKAKTFRSLTGLTKLGDFPLLKFLLIISFLSLSGVPPFVGFFAKLFLGLFFLSKGAYISFGLFIIFNVFAIYFYLQNMRYIFQQSTRKSFKTLTHTTYFDRGLLTVLIMLTWFIAFGFLFLEGLLLIILSMVT